MQKQKGFSSILIIVIIALLVIGATGLVVYLQAVEPGTDQSQKLIACAQDAKQCLDGSYVSRVPPTCEFAKCPEVKDQTASWKTYKNNYCGFEFKFPDNLKIDYKSNETYNLSSRPYESCVVYLSNGDDVRQTHFYFRADILNVRWGKSIQDYISFINENSYSGNKHYGTERFKLLNSKEIMVDNHASIEQLTSYDNDEKLTTYIAEGTSDVWTFEMSGFDKTKNYIISKKDLDIYHKILSTFKFTK